MSFTVTMNQLSFPFGCSHCGFFSCREGGCFRFLKYERPDGHACPSRGTTRFGEAHVSVRGPVRTHKAVLPGRGAVCVGGRTAHGSRRAAWGRGSRPGLTRRQRGVREAFGAHEDPAALRSGPEPREVPHARPKSPRAQPAGSCHTHRRPGPAPSTPFPRALGGQAAVSLKDAPTRRFPGVEFDNPWSV